MGMSSGQIQFIREILGLRTESRPLRLAVAMVSPTEVFLQTQLSTWKESP